jgi:hypothetical protein
VTKRCLGPMLMTLFRVVYAYGVVIGPRSEAPCGKRRSRQTQSDQPGEDALGFLFTAKSKTPQLRGILTSALPSHLDRFRILASGQPPICRYRSEAFCF